MKQRVKIEKGLAIGGYKSQFLADFFACYFFKVTNNQTKYILRREVYIYGGLLVFKNRKPIYDIILQRDKFQDKVGKTVGNTYLQLTCGTWNPGGSPYQNETRNISIIIDQTF